MHCGTWRKGWVMESILDLQFKSFFSYSPQLAFVVWRYGVWLECQGSWVRFLLPALLFSSQKAVFLLDLGLNFITKSWIVHLREVSRIWALYGWNLQARAAILHLIKGVTLYDKIFYDSLEIQVLKSHFRPWLFITPSSTVPRRETLGSGFDPKVI